MIPLWSFHHVHNLHHGMQMWLPLSWVTWACIA
jgi:hypothetical protein